jgi:cytochrome P450
VTDIVSFPYAEVGQRMRRFASAPLTVNIYDWYQELLREHVIFFDQTRDAWLVLGYQEAQQVLLDHQTFSSERWVDPDGKLNPATSGSILGMDPPDHRRLRALVSQAFTPRVIANLEPRIVAIVRDLLDRAEEKGEMDLIDDLAYPLPIMVIAELLGVPYEDQKQFRRWSLEIVGVDLDARFVALEALGRYLQQMIEQRRREPREDLISDMLHAEVDGKRLPDVDTVGLARLLLVAGHETTTGLIGNAVVCFDEHPESLQDVLAHPDLWSSAIEEILRYRGIAHTRPSVVKKDTVLAGRQIKAGELVVPIFAAANLDERQFPNANTFDIRRSPNRHLGFGHGIHYCLGGPLARLETRIALQMLYERFPGIHRNRAVPLAVKTSYFVYGLQHLSVEW